MSAADEDDALRAPEVIAAARGVAAMWDKIEAEPELKERLRLTYQVLREQRRFALAVAVEAAKALDSKTKEAVLLIAASAELFRMCRGEPVTAAQFVALIVGADPESDLPYDAAVKLEAQLEALGSTREACDKWLN